MIRISAHIDYAALRHNAALLRQWAGGAKILAVIKSNAYGHGLEPVAQALTQQVDAFGVVHAEELRRLRAVGIRTPIVLLGGALDIHEFAQASSLEATLVVHDSYQLDFLKQKQYLFQKHAIWLKFNTGMNRLGFHPDNVELTLRTLRSFNNVHWPVTLMSHLADADLPAEEDATRRQWQCFLKTGAGWALPRSIANSAALMQWPALSCSWSRSGLALFGISPFYAQGESGADWGLKPVMRLYSRLLALRHLKPGDAVGYGGEWGASKPTTIGIVAAGYANGMPAHGGFHVAIGSRVVPAVGRTSMDMIAVDLGDNAREQPGDQVTLWDETMPIESMARQSGVSPYHLLTRLGDHLTYQYEDRITKVHRADHHGAFA